MYVCIVQVQLHTVDLSRLLEVSTSGVYINLLGPLVHNYIYGLSVGRRNTVSLLLI